LQLQCSRARTKKQIAEGYILDSFCPFKAYLKGNRSFQTYKQGEPGLHGTTYVHGVQPGRAVRYIFFQKKDAASITLAKSYFLNFLFSNKPYIFPNLGKAHFLHRKSMQKRAFTPSQT